MRVNVKVSVPQAHEGGRSAVTSPRDELRRTVMACMLWENGFYESGESVVDRIRRLVPLVDASGVAVMALDARQKQRLRHVPLLLMRELARNPGRLPTGVLATFLCEVIERPDELGEFLSIYWSDEKAVNVRARKPLANQVKKGLARALQKFNEYQLAKWNRDSAVSLRDVLFMTHAKPKDADQAALWKRLANNELVAPDTWEVALSSGSDKRETFERLLRERKLGYMALLRNLRNMQNAEVDPSLVFAALSEGAATSKALPFRYVAAARAVPAWENAVDNAMMLSMKGMDELSGSTVVLVDVSGSMEDKLSAKSDLTRLDAASALAVLVSGISKDVRIFTFSDRLAEVPRRSGMALIDAIRQSQPHSATNLNGALSALGALVADRIIVITDEQATDRWAARTGGKSYGYTISRGYMVNVATNEYGVGYGDWTTISGFSESIVAYIAAAEKAEADRPNVVLGHLSSLDR